MLAVLIFFANIYRVTKYKYGVQKKINVLATFIITKHNYYEISK